MLDDGVVACGAGFDYLAGDEVGVDNGEGVGWFGEEGGDGGFAGCDGACKAEEEHCGRLVEGSRGRSMCIELESVYLVGEEASRWWAGS